MGQPPSKLEAVSQAVVSNVQSTVNSAIVNMVSSTNATLSGTQIIDISGVRCTGSINLSNMSQKAVLKYDLSKLSTSNNYQSIKSSITQGLNNTLNSDMVIKKGAISLGTDLGAKTESQAISTVVSQLANSYTFNNFSNDITQINASQTISIKDIMNQTGDCNLSNMSQSIVLEALAKQIAKSVSENLINLISNTNLSQETISSIDYTQTGILQDLFSGLSNLFSSVSGFFWIILIVVFAALFGLGYLVYSMFSDDAESAKVDNRIL